MIHGKPFYPFLFGIALLGCALMAQADEMISDPQAAASKKAWDTIPPLIARLKAPEFSNRKFLITDYGAVGNGTADCTKAFRDAIDECHRAGGGQVLVPAGIFLTGPIHLKSNVDL